MGKVRMRWVFGASLIAASLALAGAGVAVATGSTGSVVAEVIGAGSMSHGAGFSATPGTEHRRGRLHGRSEFVHRLAHAPRQDARDGEIRDVHGLPRPGLRAEGLWAWGRVRRAAVDGSRRSERDRHRRRARRGVLRSADRGKSSDRSAPAERLRDTRSPAATVVNVRREHVAVRRGAPMVRAPRRPVHDPQHSQLYASSST